MSLNEDNDGIVGSQGVVAIMFLYHLVKPTIILIMEMY